MGLMASPTLPYLSNPKKNIILDLGNRALGQYMWLEDKVTTVCPGEPALHSIPFMAKILFHYVKWACFAIIQVSKTIPTFNQNK